ncbi:hypothetical protein [Nocardia spumae]|uniref:hypothetical protein n=1 Tax=Nocardia spumae TaxID=2887190 RepID=UPI001D156FD4|nr:hypothetical protein [Nocardia spumae]
MTPAKAGKDGESTLTGGSAVGAKRLENSTARGQTTAVSGRHRSTNSNKQQPATLTNNHEPAGRAASPDKTNRSSVASKDAIDVLVGDPQVVQMVG